MQLARTLVNISYPLALESNVAQVSSWSKSILKQIQDSSLLRFESQISPSLSPSQLRRLGRWLIIISGLTILLMWNWKLVLATLAGIGVMFGIYFLPTQNWQNYWSKLYHFATSSQRQLTLAVVSGGVAALITYMVTSIWVNTENRWLATGVILQGLGTLLTIVLLVWQIAASRWTHQETKLDQLLEDLTHPKSLKRLMAVRKLTRLVYKNSLNQVHHIQCAQYLQVMLSQEEDKIIRQAILDALEIIGQSKPLHEIHEKSTLVQVPVNLKYKPVQINGELEELFHEK